LVVCKASQVMRKRLAKSLNLPMEVRPHVGALRAASLASKSRLQIGQANVIRPSMAADRCPMRAMIVGAIDQEAANAGGARISARVIFWRVAGSLFISLSVANLNQFGRLLLTTQFLARSLF